MASSLTADRQASARPAALESSRADACLPAHGAEAARITHLARCPICISLKVFPSVNILCPILTEENHVELLRRAVHRPKREVERLRAELAPHPDVPDMIRSLPQPSTCAGASSGLGDSEPDGMPETKSADAGEPLPPPPQTPARRDAATPIAEDRVKFQFTGSEELRRKIERAREILRHKHPQGKLEDIIGEALDAFLAKKYPEMRIEGKRRRSEGRRQSHPSRKPRTRYIPQHVKDIVWQRDEGRCQYTSPDGRRSGHRHRGAFGFLVADWFAHTFAT